MNDSTLSGGLLKTLSVALLGLTMAGCSDSSWWSSNDEPELKAEQIKKLIPSRVHDRQSWANDIDEIMQKLSIAKTKDNVCTVIAVVDQESNFVANPVVAGLGEKSVREVSTRLNEKFEDKLGKTIGGPVAGYFEDVLKNQPSKEDNYMSQMRKVRTEQDLDVLYREMFDYMAGHYHVSAITGAAKLVGQDIAEKMNPITTLGSMQVNIVYAKEHKRVKLQSVNDLRDDLYTQYGGLYYGIHRLMLYKADYSKPLYRFADYNSGMYSSRNASVQDMINKLSGEQLQLSLQHLGQGAEQGLAFTGLLQAPLQGVELLPVLMQGLQPLLFSVAGRAKAVQAALPGVIAQAAALAQALQGRLGGGGEGVAIDHRQPTHPHQLVDAFPCGGTPQLACLLLQQAAVQA